MCERIPEWQYPTTTVYNVCTHVEDVLMCMACNYKEGNKEYCSLILLIVRCINLRASVIQPIEWATTLLVDSILHH